MALTLHYHRNSSTIVLTTMDIISNVDGDDIQEIDIM